MGNTNTYAMARGRALMTKREREIVSGEADVGDKYRYETISRVRNRIRELIPKDLEAMEQHGGLADDLREVVCDE